MSTEKTLEERVATLEAIVEGFRAALGGNRPPGVGAVADDQDLDGQYGDPEIRFDPREKYWKGPSFVGKRFSQCRADYLDAMAKYLDAGAFMANKNGDAKGATYKTRDAARARGWAKRIRAGYGGRPASANGGSGVDDPYAPRGGADDLADDDEVPFIVCFDREPLHLRKVRRWLKF